MGKGILLSGEVRTVTERRYKTGERKVLGHQYQVEVAEFGERVKPYDLFEWGEVQKHKKGDMISDLPVIVEVSEYTGDIEFRPLNGDKNGGNGEQKKAEQQKRPGVNV